MNATTKNTGSDLNFKKVDVEIVKLKEDGDEVTGKLLSRSVRPWFDRETGEEKPIQQLHFVTVDESQKKFTLFGDAGLMNCLNTADIQDGSILRIVRGKQVSLGGGKKVNSYEVYQAQM